MKYKNLIEDEKEARLERNGIRLAGFLVILGIIFFALNIKKENN